MQPRRRLGAGQRADLHGAQALRLLADAPRLRGPGPEPARRRLQRATPQPTQPVLEPASRRRSAAPPPRADAIGPAIATTPGAARSTTADSARRQSASSPGPPRSATGPRDRSPTTGATTPFIRGPVTPPGRRRRPGLRRPARRPPGRGPRRRHRQRRAGASRPTAASTPPPTIHRGLCLFGTQERLGLLPAGRRRPRCVWRLRAAPVDERIVAYGQLESPWPVPGSVLVVDDVAYFAAGRQSLADGGILVFAVEPAERQRPLGQAARQRAADEVLRLQRPGVRQLRPAAPRGRRAWPCRAGSSTANPAR